MEIGVRQMSGGTLSIQVVPGTKILEIKEELLLRVEPRCEPLVALTTSEVELLHGLALLRDEDTVATAQLGASSELQAIFKVMPHMVGVECTCEAGAGRAAVVDVQCPVVKENAFAYSQLQVLRVTSGKIKSSAFEGCKELRNLCLRGVTEIHHRAFSSCSSLVHLELPNSLLVISDFAFADCRALRKLLLPNSLQRIGSKAFRDCHGLTELTIPDSVTHIGEAAFTYCSFLTSVCLPTSLTHLGSEAFKGCISLSHLTMPYLRIIRHGTFTNCSSLRELKLPSSVIEIGHDAFAKCSSLSLFLPSSIRKIGDSAFADCRSLELDLAEEVEIGSLAFEGCRVSPSAAN